MDIVESNLKFTQVSQTCIFPIETSFLSNVSLSPKIQDDNLHKSVRISQKISGKWQKKEINRWLCFIVKYSLDHPYDDVLVEMIFNNFQKKIYQQMAKQIHSRNANQCQLFTKAILRQTVKRGQSKLVPWAMSKLKKCQQEDIKRLVNEYELILNSKSQYMAFIEKMTSELVRKDEDNQEEIK